MNAGFYKDTVEYIKAKIADIDKIQIMKVLNSRIYSSDNIDAFYNFLVNEENRVIIYYYYKELIHIYMNKQTNKELDFNWVEDFNSDLSLLNNFVNREKLAKWYYPIFKYSFLMIIYGSNNIKDLKHKVELNKRYSENIINKDNIDSLCKITDTVLYRGQSDIKWTISPSILRNLNKNIILDNEFYKYNARKYVEKYNKLINYGKDKSLYHMYAFAQHSFSYSPLIDFTTNIVTAVSFALCNKRSINDFYDQDSAVYSFVPDENLIVKDENMISRMLEVSKIIVLNQKTFVPGKTYVAKKYNGGKKVADVNVEFTTFSKILNHLIPSFCFFDVKTNDRMIYQKGLFLYMYGEETVAFGDRIYYELNPNFKFTKYKITFNDKEKLLNHIYTNYRELDYGHLIDPYQIFNE